jgi:hypothetical protein
MIRALPKRLQKLVAANPDKIEVGHSEQDDFNGPRTWSHWIYLRKGWHNASVDPMPGLHTIHEPSVADCIRQFRGIKPCSCEECR